MDIACEYNSEQEITAFAFRTHAHDLGKFKVTAKIVLRMLGMVDSCSHFFTSVWTKQFEFTDRSCDHSLSCSKRFLEIVGQRRPTCTTGIHVHTV